METHKQFRQKTEKLERIMEKIRQTPAQLTGLKEIDQTADGDYWCIFFQYGGSSSLRELDKKDLRGKKSLEAIKKWEKELEEIPKFRVKQAFEMYAKKQIEMASPEPRGTPIETAIKFARKALEYAVEFDLMQRYRAPSHQAVLPEEYALMEKVVREYYGGTEK